VTLFSDVDAGRIEFLPMGTEDDLEDAIQRALSRGTHVLLCDSETQEDLSRLAKAARRIQKPILWTGSAGLAHALASVFPASEKAPAEHASRDGRTLLFVGTEHPVTALQVSQLQQQPIEPEYRVHRVDWNPSSAGRVQGEFADGPVAALILTGGDTAAFVLQALGASGIRLAGELATGIPWGFIEGGQADGCAVVTKSGGFGSRDALVNAVNFCSRRMCESA
jgi:uncharacterized protein YgbK (DUF1537 family)